MNKGGIPERNGELKIRANFKNLSVAQKKTAEWNHMQSFVDSLVVTEPWYMDMLERDLVMVTIRV